MPLPHTRWTVLLYLAGHDDLEPWMARTLLTLEQQLDPLRDTEVLVQLARAPLSLLQPLLPYRFPTDIDGDWCGVRRYRLRPRTDDTPARRYAAELLADLGPINTADPNTLTEFLTYGYQAFPADHFLLAISAHGLGFPGLIYDLAAGPHPWHMTVRGLRAALRAARRTLDILLLDACAMNSLEAICELAGRRRVAGWLIVPDGPSPRWGVDYGAVLPMLGALATGSRQPDRDLPARLARRLTDAAARLLALDLDPDRWQAVACAARASALGTQADSAQAIGRMPARCLHLAAGACAFPPEGRGAQFLIWPDASTLPELFHPLYRPLRFARLSGWHRLLPPAAPHHAPSPAGMVAVPGRLLRNWLRLLRPELNEIQLADRLDLMGWRCGAGSSGDEHLDR